MRDLARRSGAEVLAGVDGGVTLGNAAEVAGWGADVVVSGSASYDRTDTASPAANLELMIKQLSHSEEAPDGKR